MAVFRIVAVTFSTWVHFAIWLQIPTNSTNPTIHCKCSILSLDGSGFFGSKIKIDLDLDRSRIQGDTVNQTHGGKTIMEDFDEGALLDARMI